jgi:hypothetical protein
VGVIGFWHIFLILTKEQHYLFNAVLGNLGGYGKEDAKTLGKYCL